MKNQIKYYKKYIITCLAGLLLLNVGGCKKAIDVGEPANKLSGATVFTSNGTAQSAIAGILTTMGGINRMYNGIASMSLQLGQAADELINYSAVTGRFYTNNLSNLDAYYWPEIYLEMYQINAAVTGLTNTTSLKPAIRDQLLGEVKFLRAFVYFYAVNLYGDVPLILTTDYLTNNVLARTPQQQVYAQIIKDLKDAQLLLPDNKYLSGTGTASTDRVHPNKQAVNALLARVYLYQQDWVNAEAMATSVISASSYALEPINSVFLKASREAIWQLFPSAVGYNNADAVYLVVTSSPTSSSSQVPLNTPLLNAFEANDARRANWVSSYFSSATATTYNFAYKYKANVINANTTVTEYPIMMRLAEQYLIRAEARAQQTNMSGAVADINIIRARARQTITSLPDYPVTISQTDCLTAIAHERQVELFTEQGHRWFDLRRTGKIDAVMNVVAPQKGGTWNSDKQLIPIPATEIVLNPNLVQNPGYIK